MKCKFSGYADSVQKSGCFQLKIQTNCTSSKLDQIFFILTPHTQVAAEAKSFLIFGRQFSCSTGAGRSGMCSYEFPQFPEGPDSGPDTLLEGQPSCLFCRFSDPPSTGG
ncbi:hypothetical protein AYI70_g11658 [Smittium culicis]|uniref:Uncharacterized protein n=1 Tax=Smittium culicis TaxID=133412 RepID=A0A1R1X0V4_9FUNG|nr:hypothetical protein AYI70_g11658 [Smittium culicis]